MCIENNPEARVQDANSLLRCQRRRLLPFNADFRQEIISRRARLGQNLVTTIPVVADCRGADEGLRGIRQVCQRVTQQLCAFDTALAYALFLVFSPTPCGNAFAGEINHRIKAFNPCERDAVSVGTPLNLNIRAWRVPDKSEDLMTFWL